MAGDLQKGESRRIMRAASDELAQTRPFDEEMRIKDCAMDSSIVGIALADLEGNITYVNQAALRMWGAEDASELLGKPGTMFARSEEEALEVLRAVLEDGRWEGEIAGIRKDGSPIIVLSSASLVRNDSGEPICTMSSFVDITERKRLEEEMRLREHAIASSIDGIAIGDLEGNVTYANEAALKMWGAKDLSEVLGMSATMFAGSEEAAQEIFLAVLERGGWSGETTGVTKDGSPRVVHLSASLVRNDNDEPVCIMSSFVDITEQKRVEEEMRLREHAIASSIDGIAIGDLEGNVTYANEAALKMWGAKDLSEVLGMSATMFASSEEAAQEIFLAVLERGGWSGETTGVTKDGSPRVVHLSASLVRNHDNEPVCIMSSFVDITEQKRVEEEMRIKDNAIASSLNGIVLTDLEGNITYANRAALEMWGTSDPSEVLGKPGIMFAQSEEEALEVLHSILEKGSWSGELSGIKKDGSPIVVLSLANLVRNQAGEQICIMGSFVDITWRKIAEQELLRAKNELEKRVEERTEELRMKSLNLEEANTALKVLLKQREQDKDELEERVLANVKELVMPYIERLLNSKLDRGQRTYVNIIESNVRDIVSPFLKKLASQYLSLTPTEIQVADLVKAGKPTKEIAELLNISDRGVEFHRNNIRKKLGLKRSKVNLRSYLLSLA